MVEHARRLTERLIRERQLDAHALAVEVASNDGYLLQHYVGAGVPVLGIEPAGNVAAVAEKKGVRTVSEFFGGAVAEKLKSEGFRADVIHANNVLAHVADLNGFVSGLKTLVKDDGAVIVEVPYVRDMIEQCEFDTIYHEHLCYFSLTALQHLFARHGLAIVDVERLPIHGGSLRISGVPVRLKAESTVTAMLEEEARWGVARAEAYAPFAARVERIGQSLRVLVDRLRAEGKTVAAYGAAANGSTLLNFAGIGRERLDFVADRSTPK